MRRKVVIHECAIRTLPDGRAETVTKPISGPLQEINETGVDEAIAAAKKLAKSRGCAIRSVSMLANGDVQVVVWKNGRPPTPVSKGWLWKRPKAQPAS